MTDFQAEVAAKLVLAGATPLSSQEGDESQVVGAVDKENMAVGGAASQDSAFATPNLLGTPDLFGTGMAGGKKDDGFAIPSQPARPSQPSQPQAAKPAVDRRSMFNDAALAGLDLDLGLGASDSDSDSSDGAGGGGAFGGLAGTGAFIESSGESAAGVPLSGIGPLLGESGGEAAAGAAAAAPVAGDQGGADALAPGSSPFDDVIRRRGRRRRSFQ